MPHQIVFPVNPFFEYGKCLLWDVVLEWTILRIIIAAPFCIIQIQSFFLSCQTIQVNQSDHVFLFKKSKYFLQMNSTNCAWENFWISQTKFFPMKFVWVNMYEAQVYVAKRPNSFGVNNFWSVHCLVREKSCYSGSNKWLSVSKTNFSLEYFYLLFYLKEK